MRESMRLLTSEANHRNIFSGQFDLSRTASLIALLVAKRTFIGTSCRRRVNMRTVGSGLRPKANALATAGKSRRLVKRTISFAKIATGA